MKLARVEQLAVFYAPTRAEKRKVGRLALNGRQILFEYDPGFIAAGLELSPFRLRLKTGVSTRDATQLEGLMGVFDDSLPDGWGRLLLDRRAVQLGISSAALTPLDRLALVGQRGMGALVYEPETLMDDPGAVTLAQLAKDAALVLDDAGNPDLQKLIAAGGSPQGARPKALIQIDAKGGLHFDAGWVEDGRTAWLVKFNAPTDGPHSAALEHAYARMAAAAGIDVPETRLLAGARRVRHFASKRFDRVGVARVHSHTLGGLLELARGYPALDYRDVLKVTRQLTRDETAVLEQYRRACFNVLAHNRDDHSRNFAFLMDSDGAWRLSPAYDLTFAEGPGGEHTTLVVGEGRAPNRRHLERLAHEADVKRATTALDQVRAAVADFPRFAEEARVPKKETTAIAARLTRS